MVLSYYLYKYPYKLLWYLREFLFGNNEIAFYCADPLDYEMFIPIQKHLPTVQIIAKNKKTRNYLNAKAIPYKRMPYFPKAIIMARQQPYKFPVKKIIKFGFDHGLYQFKRWTSARNYNEFDVYFVSSDEQVKLALQHGIKSTFAVGYPKLDKAFNGEYNESSLHQLKKSLKIDPFKKTILFSSTWNVDGLSQVHKWIDRVDELRDEYNILTTVHTWTEKRIINKLKKKNGILFLDDYDITPYLMLADLLVGDYNSLIGEFCAFNKPIITFKVPESSRTIPEILSMLKRISIQVESFDELKNAIRISLMNPQEKSQERLNANKILFLKLDGQAGKRAAEKIIQTIKERDK